MAEGSEKDTSPTEYQSLCHQLYTNTTVQERRKILKYCDVERKFMESNDIEDDVKYILKLEDKKMISETDVEPLLECLQKLGMLRLADIVKSYQSTILAESVDGDSRGVDSEESVDWESRGGDSQEMTSFESCKHLDEGSQLLCVSCCMYVCYECTFFDHKDHEVFPEEEFDNEIKVYQRLVQEELNNVHEMTDSFEKDVNTPKANVRYGEIKRNIAIIAKCFSDSIERQLCSSENKLRNSNQNRDLTQVEIAKELQHLLSLTESIQRDIEIPSDMSHLVLLQKINTYTHQIEEGMKQAERIRGSLKDDNIFFRFCPAAISANFVGITVGLIVGAVRVSQNQVVIVTDQRHHDIPSVRLSSVSCANTAHLYWSYSIEEDCFLGFGSKVPKIALCSTLLVSQPNICILFGCGSTLIKVNIRATSEESCYFESRSVKDFNLPKCSFISSINIVRSQGSGSIAVLLTDSYSKTIYKLDKELTVTERIDVVEKPCLVTGFFDMKFVYAYSDGKVVKLINGTSSKCIIRNLEKPHGDESFYPADMFHDAAAFSILWKSEGQQKKLFKVMVYSSSGDLIRISHEGTYSNNNEALSIGFVKNNGLLCLSNGKVKLYDTL